MHRLCLVFVAALWAGLGCAAAAQDPADAAAPTAAGSAAHPSLVVFITVDQLRPDYLTRWHDQLSGGLRRLVDQGAFFTRGTQDHAITETAPGHATTMSGRFPYSTGIASNSAGVNTPDAPLVGGTGVGASPFRFRGTTLADWMAAADPRVKVLSVSRKDRGAILPIGRGKYPVFWYAPSTGGFVTSTWYADTLPTWVQAFGAENRVVARYGGQAWGLSAPGSSYPEPDSVPAEDAGREFLFPHVMPTDTAAARAAFISFPWMDEYTLDFAWRGVRALGLGAGPQTDLLAVSLSTTDAVGHRFGPDSRELHDQILRLDKSLGAFLDSLVALRGAGNVVVALTADHGVAPSPEVQSTFGDNAMARRVMGADFDAALGTVAPVVQRLKLDPTAFGFDGQTLDVDRSKVAGKEKDVLAVARAFAAAARKVGGVERVDVIDDLARADTVRDDIARRWLHMFRPGGEVLVAITLTPYSLFGTSIVATHGSPHDYDARVPIIFWGPGIVPGRSDRIVRVVDMAPTLAALLGVKPTEKLDGVPIRSVLVPASATPRE
ncbi:MAG: alkaline phosphatase family protein [Gemmatimonadota bacterium]|nr:alkaline phosphatase family protein [Gemmatimonadota bacterium]